MANPFKDAEKKKKVAPGGEKEPQKEEVTVVDPPKVETPKVETPKQDPPENPLAGMIAPKQEGKAYSFYLSAEANDKLEKLAKQNKCSKSKALDALLRSLT